MSQDGTAGAAGACGTHAGLGAELRGTALLLLDRVRAAVEPLGEGAAPEPGSPGACQACPVCAVLAVLRGERSDLAARLAEHATALVAVLAAVLEGDGPAAPTGPRPEPAGPETARPDHARHTDPPRQTDTPRHTDPTRPGYQPRVPGAHGRSVQRIAVHRR